MKIKYKIVMSAPDMTQKSRINIIKLNFMSSIVMI